MGTAGALLAVAVLMATGCGEWPDSAASPDPGPTAGDLFVDRAREFGVEFSYANGMTGKHYLLEVMGGGAAVLDYDNDGDLDLYLVQGGGPNGPVSAAAGSDRLYRNDLTPGSATPRFTDVTGQSGIRAAGYGMGVATGDYDNDGRVDLYLTNWGANQLWRNRGDGTFADVTAQAGAGDDRWSVASVFFDYDHDGFLDLYVGNYVDFRLETHKVCIGFGATEDYCGPAAYPAQPDRMLRNRGDGTFADVTTAAGLHRELGPALGAVAADFDGDGWSDLYVANDQAENLLWINRQNGGFDNQALLAGCAVSGEGKAEASMGVAAADFNGDGHVDLFSAHLTGESNTFYQGDGKGNFEDATVRAGLGAASLEVTGFGTVALDYDRDGWLDLLVANGAVHRIEELHRRGEPYPLQQPNQLVRNLGSGVFEDVSRAAGAAFELAAVSRGAAAGDLDNDGDKDVVIVNSNGPTRLLVNDAADERHWLGVRVLERRGKRDAVGAWVALHRTDRPPLWRRAHTDGSYASASDPRVLFGLGEDPAVDRLEVRWPGGGIETWDAPRVDRYVTIRQGTGR